MPNLLWAPVNVILKYALEDGVSPTALACVRWSTLALVMGLAMRGARFRELTGAVWPSLPDVRRLLLYGFLFFGPSHAIYYWSLQRTSSFEGNILGTTAPIWSTVLAFFFLHERPGTGRIVGIVIGTIGAYAVSVGLSAPSLDAGHTLGNVTYLSAVLLESVSGVLAIQIARRSSGITALWFEVLGAAGFLLLAPFVLPSVFPFAWNGGPTALLCLAYLVLVAGFFNFGVWYRLAERTPVSLLALSLLIQPPVAAVCGYWFLGERFGRDLWIGSALILAGLVVGTVRLRRATVA